MALRRLWLLMSLSPGACIFVGGPPELAGQLLLGGGASRGPRDDLRSIVRAMQDIDTELMQNATAPVNVGAACHKLEVLARHLRRDIEESLENLERACRAPDGALNDPSQVVLALSAFLDREVWVVNATMRAATRATRDLVELLPQEASRRAAPYLASLDGLPGTLMSTVQGELQGLSRAAHPCGTPSAASSDHPGSLGIWRQAAAGASAGAAWSPAREMRSSLVAVAGPLWGADLAGGRPPPWVRELQAVRVSSPFMVLSQEVLVAAVGAMSALEDTIRSMATDRLPVHVCGGAGSRADRPARSGAVAARGGPWARLLCVSVLSTCAAAR